MAELADGLNAVPQAVERGVGVHPQPVGQAVAAGRARLVPPPRTGPGPDTGGGQRLEHGVEVVAAWLLEQRRTEPDHLGGGVPRVDVHVVLGEGGERRVDELAQRGQRLPALRHRALGAAQQVPVPVDHAGDHDAVRFVDQRGRLVLLQDRRSLAGLGDDTAGHRDRPSQ